jgi:hypothetical protein
MGRKFFIIAAIFASFIGSTPSAFAKKTNQAIYQDPYDLAAGGASLTRASRAGRLFANPALLPYGGVFSLWFGSTTSVYANDGVCELAASPCPITGSGAATSQDASAAAASDGTTSADPDVLNLAFRKPFRAGLSQNFAWVTSHVGFSIFSRSEVDLDAQKVGSTGTPQVDFQMESYSGIQLGFAMRSPVRWFSLGGAVKGVVASEPELSLGLDVMDKLQGDQAQSFFQSQFSDKFAPRLGYGVDIGTLFFFQGSSTDFSLAAKIDDVGNTKLNPAPGLSGMFGSQPTAADGEGTATEEVAAPVAGVMSAGSAVTLHTGADQIHLALDYRDIANVYAEPMFKRVYAGTKVTLRQHVGFATGIYHGYPSGGVELDLFFVQFSVSTYTRELGDKPGVNPRHYYVVSLSGGG